MPAESPRVAAISRLGQNARAPDGRDGTRVTDRRAQRPARRKEANTPKYLVQANYLEDGLKGLLKEGGTSRRDAVTRLVESVGGTLEPFYVAFGERDAYVTVLITPEEIDAATKATVSYRAPGD